MINDKAFCIVEMLFDENKRPFDYRFLTINRNFEQQTGLKQALGKRMRELVPNHDKHWFEIYGEVSLTGEAIHFEHFASALDRWYEVYAFPVEQVENKNSNVAILFREVEELQPLVKTINNPRLISDREFTTKEFNKIYHLDLEGKFSFISEQLCERLGYSQGELVDRTIAEIMHPEDVAKNLDLLARMATTTLPYRLKQQLLCRDGSAIAVKIIALPIFNLAKAIECIRTVVIDDSKAQRLESRLQKSERRLSWLAEIIQDVFWVLDYKKSRIVYLSPSYEKIWGRSRNEIYGDRTCWIETIHSSDRQTFLETTASYDYLNGKPVKYRILRPDGSLRWISDRGYAIRDSQGQIDQIVGVARDVTAPRQTQLRLERNNQILKLLSDTAINLLQHSNPNEQIDNLLNRLIPLLQLKCYYFYLLTEDKMHLQLELSQGIDEATRHKMQTVKLDESVCGIAFKSQGRLEIQNLQNMSSPQYDLLRSLGITAHACYTVIVKDRAVGAISFSRDTDNSFNAEEITLLRTVSNLVSLAMSNYHS
ncbi:PAS domain S-box protein [Pleurocapsales cyanobacterium LEGE 10410]|nr:PAS domain S-box protein [Pleurocapsales cyanobacterium LEGE 10410]